MEPKRYQLITKEQAVSDRQCGHPSADPGILGEDSLDFQHIQVGVVLVLSLLTSIASILQTHLKGRRGDEAPGRIS